MLLAFPQLMYVVQQKLAEHRLRTSTYEINTMDATAAVRAVEQMRVMQVGVWWLGWSQQLGRMVGAKGSRGVSCMPYARAHRLPGGVVTAWVARRGAPKGLSLTLMLFVSGRFVRGTKTR